MVETGASGRIIRNLGAVAEDIIPDVDDTRSLGSSAKKWAALWVVLALVTSITIGGAIKLTAVDGVLFVNASTEINGSLSVMENITAKNISATEFFFGDGSKLTNVVVPTPNIFDQTLNTTDNVTFFGINVSNWGNVSITESQVNDLSHTSLTNVALINNTNIFTENQNLSSKNWTNVNCIIFDSGGEVCTG